MTDKSNFKRIVRQRAAKTGESYTAARRHLVGADKPSAHSMIAVAQTILRTDPRSSVQLAESGRRIRELMHDAANARAVLAHFPEGALTSPSKRLVSSGGPEIVAEADWSTVDRAAIKVELEAIADNARKLDLWTVVGGIAFSVDFPRPTNALFVISSRGAIVGRYDERMLSKTKSTFMYRAGTDPLVFEAQGIRFGCALGMESQYPEHFAAYDQADVDCVLLSTAGNPEFPNVFAVEAAGHAAAHSYWVSYAGPAHHGEPPSGVISPTGSWVARCTQDHEAIAIAEIDAIAGANAREWRRTARAAAAAR